MCGIVGIFCTSHQAPIERETLLSMRDTMLHRGPDGGGEWMNEKAFVAFGHRRLSIVDLSNAANQPMQSISGRYTVVFNGEIYNFQDVKKELESTGSIRWNTDHSDTEVLIEAYERWGVDSVHKLQGMFAFAIWDSVEQELFICRDRIGEKPLYYSFSNGTFLFASEIKALLQHPNHKRRAINKEGFFHYLSFLTTPAPMTLFEGIYKLPPSNWMKISRDGTVRQEKYWDIYTNGFSQIENKTEDEVATEILDQLRTSVQMRKMSDVPVGVFLSGGIDSSTNAALFSEGSTSTVKTFSIGYEGHYNSYENELHYAKKIAEQVGAEYYEKLLTIDDLISFLPQMVWLQDEPIADPVCVPVYYVSKLARDNGVVVAQVGEGADELFAGYPSWKRFLKLQQLNNLPIPNLFKKIGNSSLRLAGKKNHLMSEWLQRGIKDLPIFWGGAEAFSEVHKKSLLHPSLQKEFNNYSSWEVIKPFWDRFQTLHPNPNTLDWMSYVDLNFRIPELLLMRVDKMSMGVSLEGRVPFLDHKFVQMAMGIPSEWKLKNGTLKYMLKKAVRGVIPDELIDRKKQGFGVPVYEWFFDRLGETAEKAIMEFLSETELLQEKEVQKLFIQKQPQQLWYLLNVALWWKQYIQ